VTDRDAATARGAVSVVIPTCNRPRLLASTLTSVLSQRGVELDVIVVDDGSAPGMVGTVPGIEDPRVRVIRHDVPEGVSRARNTGIGVANGEWVAFVDDDDLWGPDKVAAQLDRLARSPDCGWSCVGVVTVDVRLRIIGWHRAPDGDLGAEMLVRQAVPGGGSGVLVARTLLAGVGGFDPALTLNEDWDMYLRLAQRSPMCGVDRPLLAYRLHTRNRSLDVAVCDRELDVLKSRYALSRRALGVDVDDREWRRWKASTHLLAGRRWPAILASLEPAPRGRDWRGAAATTVAAAVPGSGRVRDLLRASRVPPDWRRQTLDWLTPFRERERSSGS
jgi:glycosyltransferase involved in cell wall biosynthesis